MDNFEQKYPHIAAWIQDGIVEIGNTDYDSSFIRVLDEGGMIWSTTDAFPSLDNALAAADAAIAEWCRVHIPDLVVGSAASPSYTPKQGQYLAYIHHYTQLHGQAPAEHEIQAFFSCFSVLSSRLTDVILSAVCEESLSGIRRFFGDTAASE